MKKFAVAFFLVISLVLNALAQEPLSYFLPEDVVLTIKIYQHLKNILTSRWARMAPHPRPGFELHERDCPGFRQSGHT
jgi:hypothetical protein